MWNVHVFKKAEMNRLLFVALVNSIQTAELSTYEVQKINTELRRTYREGEDLLFGDPLFIILTEDPEKEKALVSIPGTAVWLLDTVRLKLLVYEDQPADYYGLRSAIEEVIAGTYPGRQNDPSPQGETEVESYILKHFPWGTALLIFANLIVFFILRSKGALEDTELMLNLGANYAPYVFEGHEYWRLFTCMFMHFSFAHLFSNMLYLGIVGFQLEKQAGTVRFLLLYLLAGLIASLVSAVFHWIVKTDAVSAGASGAVYGLIGASFVLMIREKDKAALRKALPRLILILIFIFYSSTASGNVDGAAHIGGFAAGALLSLVLVKTWRQIFAEQKKSQQ